MTMTAWPLIKIISGGQTGADQAGWRAAEQLGYDTGGVMPAEARTETGPRPDLAARYHAIIGEKLSYADRTIYNVRLADATVLFGRTASAGTAMTYRACRLYRKPRQIITEADLLNVGEYTRDTHLVTLRAWIVQYKIAVLNVAGNRESSCPGIGALVEAFLVEALKK